MCVLYHCICQCVYVSVCICGCACECKCKVHVSNVRMRLQRMCVLHLLVWLCVCSPLQVHVLCMQMGVYSNLSHISRICVCALTGARRYRGTVFHSILPPMIAITVWSAIIAVAANYYPTFTGFDPTIEGVFGTMSPCKCYAPRAALQYTCSPCLRASALWDMYSQQRVHRLYH